MDINENRKLKNDVTAQVEVSREANHLDLLSGKEPKIELNRGAVAVVVDALDPVLRGQADADEDDDEDVEGDRQKDQRLETLCHSGIFFI